MKNYKVAIIIPSWNCSMCIGSMLDSILANTFSDYKVFVVDDLSTDNSVEVLKSYQERDSRIIPFVRNRSPKGAQTCRNIGFELSEGAEYVIWFDSDDIIAPHCLEQRVAYMEKHPELDFGIFPAKTFKEDIYEFKDDCRLYGYPFFEDTLVAMLTRRLTMVGWTNIYRRESLIRVNHSWDERILSMQDSDFNIHSILKGLTFGYASKEGAKIDYFYRCTCDGKSVSQKIANPAHYGSHLYFLQKLFTSLTEFQKHKYRDELQLYIYQFMDVTLKDLSFAYRVSCRLSFFRFLNFRLRTSFICLTGKGWTFLMRRYFNQNQRLQREWNDKTKQQIDSLLLHNC